MKLTRETLKRIIKEELGRVMMEIEGECPPEHKKAAQEWANGLFQQLKGSKFEEMVTEILELKMVNCEEDYPDGENVVWEISFEIPYKHKFSKESPETIDLIWRSSGDHSAQEGNGNNPAADMSGENPDWMRFALETAGYNMTDPFTGNEPSPAGGKYEYY